MNIFNEDTNLTRFQQIYLFLSAFVIIVPVFFILDGASLKLAPSFSSQLTGNAIIPFSILAIPFIFLINLVYLKIKVSKIALLLLLIFLILPSMGYIFGVFFYENTTSKSLLRFIQTILPIISFGLSIQFISNMHIKDRIGLMVRFYEIFQFVLILVSCLYIFQTILLIDFTNRFSLLADHIGPFYNPKVKRFFPAIIAGIVCYNMALLFFSMWKNNKFKKKSFMIMMFCLGVVSAYWGRTAVVSIIMTFIYLICITKSFRLLSYVVATLVFIFGSIFTLLYFTGVNLESTLSLLRLVDMLSADELSAGDRIRIDRLIFAFSEMFKTPFGSAFSLHDDISYLTKDIAIAENGFLDLGVRSGFLAPLLIIVIALTFIFKLNKYSIYVSSEKVFGLSAFLFSQIICVGLFLHIFTEPYYSIYIWFWFGAICTSIIPLTKYLKMRGQ